MPWQPSRPCDAFAHLRPMAASQVLKPAGPALCEARTCCGGGLHSPVDPGGARAGAAHCCCGRRAGEAGRQAGGHGGGAHCCRSGGGRPLVCMSDLLSAYLTCRLLLCGPALVLSAVARATYVTVFGWLALELRLPRRHGALHRVGAAVQAPGGCMLGSPASRSACNAGCSGKHTGRHLADAKGLAYSCWACCGFLLRAEK